MIEECAEQTFVVDSLTGNKAQLDLIETTVVKCINGHRSIEEVIQKVKSLVPGDINDETIFKALDRLSDIGILNARAVPPSGGQVSTRRQFISKVVSAIAFGSLGASTLAMADNSEQAQEERAKKAQEKDAKQASREQDRKIAQEMRAKEREKAAEEREKNKNR